MSYLTFNLIMETGNILFQKMEIERASEKARERENERGEKK